MNTRLLILLLCVFLFVPISTTTAHEYYSETTASSDFVVAMAVDAVNLDPALAADASSLLVATQVYDTLVKQAPGGSLILPGLAESWSRNIDATVWTFNLRTGVVFHDSAPMNAFTVVQNFERWWDPANPAHTGSFDAFASYFGGFKNEPSCLMTGISAINPYQVQIVLSQPEYHLLTFLSDPAFSIASPTSFMAGTLDTHPVGSGPFIFSNWLAGDQINLLPNAGYWAGAPLLDSLAFRVIPIENDRLSALAAGSVHSINEVSDANLASSATNPDLQVLWRPTTSVGYMGINRAHTPLDNLLVRQAIAHAVDWQALANAYYNPGDQLAGQFLPPAVWGTNPAISAPTYDPVLAQSLLNSSGYSGFATTLSYRLVARAYLPNPALTAAAIEGYLEAININVTVTLYESTTFLSKLYAGELDLYLLGWGADYLHPDNFYTPHLCNPTNLSFGALDPILCANLQYALAEPDYAQQVLAYQTAAQTISTTLPFVPMIHARSGLLTRSNVDGLVASPIALETYHTVFFSDAVQTIVDPSLPTTLTYTDPQTEPTTVDIPVGAVEETTLLRLEPSTPTSAPATFTSVNHTFVLEAIRDGDVLQDFVFAEPITITIEYTDADVAGLKDETSIFLYVWDGNSWMDAAATCDPASTYSRNLLENRLSVNVCHLSEFALFGEPWLTFAPIIMK